MRAAGRRRHLSAAQHNLGSVTTEPADTEPEDEDSGVLVSQIVLRKIHEMTTPGVAGSVARAILSIPEDEGKPIPLRVPGDTPGTTYRVLLPDSAQAPAVIYRKLSPHDDHKWLVTALMDRDAYLAYSGGLADSQLVQDVAGTVALGTITASDALSRRSQR